MNQLQSGARRGRAMSRDVYRRLRRHLDSMPVGFPAALGGAELRILKRLFNPEEAGLALALDWKPRLFQDLAPTIRCTHPATSEAELRDTVEYARRGYGLEYLSTAVPQTRIIPIGRAVPAGDKRIATYDEFDALIRDAGQRIGLVRCICRAAADRARRPCRSTERRELCMVFRDYADTARRQAWGRTISRAEALEIAACNQEEGLVLQPSNERQPQFMCACCPDCCGLLAMIKAVPRPADFVATNFRAAVAGTACVGCGLCVKRCPMGALRMGAAGRSTHHGQPRVSVDPGRCIGCGLCVPACRKGGLVLAAKAEQTVPPADTEELMETIRFGKHGLAGKLRLAARALLGFPRK